jgi:putative phosphoribosyl transferase
VVDDGVTTGASARAAGRAARQRGARRVVLAVPVVPAGLESELRRDFDEVVALEMPAHLPAIADWYSVFEEVTDAMVVRYVKRAGEELAATMKSGLPWSGE